MTNSSLLAVLSILFLLAAAGCCCAGSAGSAGSGGSPSTVFDELDAQGQQIFINMTTVRIPAGQVAAALGDLRPASASEPRTITQAQADRLATAWQADEHIRVVQAPKILALDNMEATMFIGETIRFAKTEAATNKAGGLEFSIKDGPVFVGYQMRVVPHASADGERIALELHSVRRSMRDGPTQHEIAAMDQATFLREVVFEDRLDATFEMKNGGHVLLSDPQVREDADGKYVSVSLIRAKLLQDPQARATSLSNG